MVVPCVSLAMDRGSSSDGAGVAEGEANVSMFSHHCRQIA